MIFSEKFICAGSGYSSFEKPVPAPYLIKHVRFDALPDSCSFTVCGLGFYRLYINGRDITRCFLAPYISNPDHIIYYDDYDLLPFLRPGVNSIALLLGNGMLNAPGGTVWDFQKAPWRSAPKAAFALSYTLDGQERLIEADESVKTAPSAILFDDLRCGEHYDARLYDPSLLLPEADISGLKNAVPAETPKGRPAVCGADPVLPTGEELAPVSITPGECAPYTNLHHLVRDIVPFYKYENKSGYIYDFGVNKAGIPRLKIKGAPGQKIDIQFAEWIDRDGRLDYSNINFYPDGFSQHDVFICSGGEDVWEPKFSYYGFRYALVSGITPEQAAPDLLTYVVINSAIRTRAGFECSDETLNKLFAMTRVSDLANFVWFPTDCPHREKNGWMGDAALSAEHVIIQFDCGSSYREWLANIRAAQGEDGSVPCMVPTCTWGSHSGPSWDAALTYLPYYTYIYTGDRLILEENADAIFRYLNYISTRRTPRGTVEEYLGDWCPVGNVRRASVEFTDSVSFMSICDKAAFIFRELGQDDREKRARELWLSVRDSVRKNLVNLNTCIADNACQTSQSMAIFYDVFNEDEKPAAFEKLLEMVHGNHDYLDVGILGARALFHVLTDFGQADLAFRLITRRDWPSYGHFLEMGLTSLPEEFDRKDDTDHNSLNHHMFGDIANWMITRVAGLRYDIKNGADFRPADIKGIDWAKAYYDSPAGRIEAGWRREGEEIVYNFTCGKKQG